MRINVAQQLKASIGSVRNYEVNGVVDIVGDGRRLGEQHGLLNDARRGLVSDDDLALAVDAHDRVARINSFR